jgi:formiminoglutamate deiminase
MTQYLYETALLPTGWAQNVAVDITDGRFTRVAPNAHNGTRIPGITLPALVNLHSHAFQRGMAGKTEVKASEADSFWTWREVMYHFLDTMGPDEIYAITLKAFREMKAAGYGRVCEFHYVHHDPKGQRYANPSELAEQVIRAAQDADIGLTLLPVFYAHSDFGGKAPTPGQRRFIQSVDEYAAMIAHCRGFEATVEGLKVGIAPHSLRAVTPDELNALLPLAGDGPIHMHVSEQDKEVDDCLAWCGQRPVEWLIDHVGLDPRWCLIHATHVTPTEWRGMINAGAVAGLCPVTEGNLGDGVFPTTDYVLNGGRFGIGTDSNVRISAADELRMLEYYQRITLKRRNRIAAEGASVGRTLFDGAAHGGAQASGTITSAIAVGAEARVFTLDPNSAQLEGLSGNQILDGWVFG